MGDFDDDDDDDDNDDDQKVGNVWSDRREGKETRERMYITR